MRQIIFSLCLLALVGAGCANAPTAGSKMPDTFYAHGTWRFDGDEYKINFGVHGVAMLDWQFTRQMGDQYLVEGTVSYDQSTLGCAIAPRPSLCTKNTCSVSGTTVGEITGVAEVRGDQLVINAHWLTKPDESVDYVCTDTLGDTYSGWAVWQTMGPLGAKLVEETWTVDVSGVFIDDLPSGEVIDTPTISANISTVANDVTAEGLIGFYRQWP